MELGSGLGFTGSAICQQCRPLSFLFTDCHKQVLDKLSHNVHLNFCDSCNEKGSGKKQKNFFHQNPEFAQYDKDENKPMLGSMNWTNNTPEDSVLNKDCWIEHNHQSILGSCHSVQMSVKKLDWEDFNPNELKSLDIDVILAAGKDFLFNLTCIYMCVCVRVILK